MHKAVTMRWFPVLCLVLIFGRICDGYRKKVDDKTKCPEVRAIRNFHLEQLLGHWYVIQYYASSEEALPYRCMRAEFTLSPVLSDVTMNFTYSFTDDPLNEQLLGNITWNIPDGEQPAHWTHSEDTYEGVYNTYVLDSDYGSWALLLHCAEKSKMPRYLSSFIMGRNSSVGVNVVSYLRDKLPRYDIDLDFMFDMPQEECESQVGEGYERGFSAEGRRHPMMHH